ncbi:MAG: glycosyltransferase family 39 protein [Blastocatellia bacterium]
MFAAGLLFYGLGWLPLLGPDEPRYTEVAREMFLSGDWITPRIGGLHWFEKPALTYWLSAAGFSIFGVTEFGARVFIALLAFFGAGALYLSGATLRSKTRGYLCATVLLSSGLWIGFGRAATFDLPLAVCMELALLCFFHYESGGAQARNRPAIWWYSCCFCLGLAVLAKGLVGIVLPGIIIGLYLLLTGGLFRFLKNPAPIAMGAVVFTLTAALWYGPMFRRHGHEFWQEFFLAHHFQRYLTNKYNHPQPFYFFPAVAVLGCLPWSFYLFPALAKLPGVIRASWHGAKSNLAEPNLAEPNLIDRLRLFLWIWALVPVLFFSFSGSKLPGYILPVFPALAMLIGLELEQALENHGFSWPGILNMFLLLVAGIYLLRGGSADLRLAGNHHLILGGSLGLIATVGLFLFFSRRSRLVAYLLPAGITLLIVLSCHLIFPVLARQESMRDLSLRAKELALPGEKLVFFINTEQSLNFYAPEQGLYDQKAALRTPMTTREIQEILREGGRESLLVISLRRWSGSLVEFFGDSAGWLAEQPRENRRGDHLDDLLLYRIRR